MKMKLRRWLYNKLMPDKMKLPDVWEKIDYDRPRDGKYTRGHTYYPTWNFTRYIGNDGFLNAYGTVLYEEWYADDPEKRVIRQLPVICGHGGTAWFCQTCADKTMENQEKK